MTYYVPGTQEKDQSKVIMSLQQAHEKTATNTTNIATNTANIVALQSPPLFKVTLATQQTITASTFTKVQFDTVTYDNNSWWDAANFVYKPQRAGYYRFSWSIYGGTSTTLTRTLGRLRLNGSTDVMNGSDAPSSAGIGSSVGSELINLNGSTDNVAIYAFIAAATAVVGLTGSAFLTTFSGEFIGT